MTKKKPGRPRGADRHSQPRLAFHLDQDLLDAIDAYCAAQQVEPGRLGVARVALQQFLEREGFWPTKKGGE